MTSDALAFVEDLNGGTGDARVNDLADQLGRHRVIVVADFDVIIRRPRARFQSAYC